MTKKPKPEPFRFNSMTKAELIRTVKALDKRQTKLLNDIARLKAERGSLLAADAPTGPKPRHPLAPKFPWEPGQ